ncbi:MAG: hypothetical protein H0X01_00890 [Nitrospira sp.]|nr:hypothetical protein [Nitrospira sp.]
MPEILEGLSTIGFHLTRNTNGTRITTQFVERLDRLPVAISVSLVTLDRVTYRHIAASITWRRFLEGIALSKAFLSHRTEARATQRRGANTHQRYR